jgi:hypothetical protein
LTIFLISRAQIYAESEETDKVSFEKLLFLLIVAAQMHQHQVELNYIQNEHIGFGSISNIFWKYTT